MSTAAGSLASGLRESKATSIYGSMYFHALHSWHSSAQSPGEGRLQHSMASNLRLHSSLPCTIRAAWQRSACWSSSGGTLSLAGYCLWAQGNLLLLCGCINYYGFAAMIESEDLTALQQCDVAPHTDFCHCVAARDVPSYGCMQQTMVIPYVSHNYTLILALCLKRQRCKLWMQDSARGFQRRYILVDDGSTEDVSMAVDTGQQLHYLFGVAFRLVRNEKPTGYGLANNAGVQAATAKVVALLHCNAHVINGWLRPLIRTI